MDVNKVAEKIEKLLSLGNSSNPHEAAAALAKAAAMMRDAGMSEADLQRRKIVSVTVRSTQTIHKPKTWELALVWSVARAFGGKVLWTSGYSLSSDYWGRYHVVMHQLHSETAGYVLSFLLRTAAKARAKRSAEMAEEGWSRGRAMTDALDSFTAGWVGSVEKDVARFASETSAELKALVDSVAEEATQGRQCDNKGFNLDADAAQRGMNEGAKVRVLRPVEGEGSQALIG